MKKAFLLAAAAIALLAVSCSKDKVQPIDISVTVDESGLASAAVKPESYEISLTNLSTAEVTKATTENGMASFNVVPGLYQVDASASASAEGRAYYFVGQVASANLSSQVQAVSVMISSSESSAIVFKELYYSCSGEYIREQFYEIYNNSDQTVYLDGLCIADAIAYGWDGTPYNFEIDNPEKYVFAQQVWQVPNKGGQYPLAPGQSAVIAEWATNHSLSTLNPASVIGDLTSSEFEALVGESTTWNGTVLTDNVAINLEHPVSAYNVPQWLPSLGGPAMMLFYPEKELNGENMISASGLYMGAREIPIEWIIDGVNCVEDETKIQNKIFPSTVDAGSIWDSGSYKGESVSRKIDETKSDGRIVYSDTNNTTNDFQVNSKPQIRRNNPGIPSWNTWAK